MSMLAARTITFEMMRGIRRTAGEAHLVVLGVGYAKPEGMQVTVCKGPLVAVARTVTLEADGPSVQDTEIA